MQHHLLGDGSHLNANIQISFPITHLSPVSASPRKRQKQLGGRVQSLRNDLYSGQLREKYGLSKANRRSRQRSVIPRAQQEQCEQPAVAKRRNLARSTQTARESRASAAPRPRGRARACVRAWFSAVYPRCPTLFASVCGNRGSPRMTSPSGTTNRFCARRPSSPHPSSAPVNLSPPQNTLCLWWGGGRGGRRDDSNHLTCGQTAVSDGFHGKAEEGDQE